VGNTTILASGSVGPNDDHLSVELVEPNAGSQAVVRINWPTTPTIVTPASYDNVSAVVTRLLSSASIELAGIRASKRL
jgi:hypothetical protein